DEEGVYAALGLAWIPPELREDVGEIDLAEAGRLPDLIELDDVRGDLHAHTDWSDGADTIEGMAAAAATRGYEYLAISDHSGSLAMAGGLDAPRVREQWRAIDKAQEATDVRLVRATEVDILADGALDHPEELLRGFDWVTASVHSSFRASRARMTRRLLAAIENPLVDAIGHPTGRMLGRRPHADVDLPAVVAAAARTGTALEINGQPRRLDLDDRMAREALAAGARLVIGSDAHSASSLGFMRYGTLVARRAGATRGDIANCLSWDELAATRPRER
ncbi:MAG: PHP domain-containing protein, partial [Miltoncostaeaceae bacterium]